MKKNNYLMRQFWLSVVGYWLLLLFCYDSWNSGCLLSLAAIIPIKSYSNAEDNKDTILKENKNKSGIYMWTNRINDQKYVGSAQNISQRFYQYSNSNHLERNTSMPICRALLKHGYKNLYFQIIE